MFLALNFVLLHLESKTNTPVLIALRRHATEMEETTSFFDVRERERERERTLVNFPRKLLPFLYKIRVAHFLKVQGCGVFPAISCSLKCAPACDFERRRVVSAQRPLLSKFAGKKTNIIFVACVRCWNVRRLDKSMIRDLLEMPFSRSVANYRRLFLP